MVRVHEEFEGGHFDFLIGGQSGALHRAFAIELLRPVWQKPRYSQVLRVQEAADAAQYALEQIESADAGARGWWWAELLRQAHADAKLRHGDFEGNARPSAPHSRDNS